MKKRNEELVLKLRPRPKEAVVLEIPKDALNSLRKVAQNQDISVEALLKTYIGQGLRQDISRLFGDRVMETTAQVLARHLQSDEEISTILHEIQVEATR